MKENKQNFNCRVLIRSRKTACRSQLVGFFFFCLATYFNYNTKKGEKKKSKIDQERESCSTESHVRLLNLEDILFDRHRASSE